MTNDEIELPPNPDPAFLLPGGLAAWGLTTLHAYARAAVEADRKRALAAPSETALRRAAKFLDGIGNGCNEVKTLRSLLSAQAAEPVAWYCPSDPDSGSAFYWAKDGVDRSTQHCGNCDTQLAPLYTAPARPAVTDGKLRRWVELCDKGHGQMVAREIEAALGGGDA